MRAVRRVAEYETGGLFKQKRRFRIDLHGVSSFGPGDAHTLYRWERVEDIAVVPGGVDVVTAAGSLRLPDGAFGLTPEALAAQLRRAADRDERGTVIDELAGGAPPG